jgi:hypothetical protein
MTDVKHDSWILNASVPDQLRAIAEWRESENPSRLVLGAVASCALNHINTVEADNERAAEACVERLDEAEAEIAELKRLLSATRCEHSDDGRHQCMHCDTKWAFDHPEIAI